MANAYENSSFHAIWEALKALDSDAWTLVGEKVVKAELESLRSGEEAYDWGVTGEDLMCMLYVEMVGPKKKINLYRDDGGNLWAWLRRYVYGYIREERPDPRHVFIEGVGTPEEQAKSLDEKISKCLSDRCGPESLQTEDPAVQHREEWELVQKCFADLYRRNPMRAYVHWLKLRMNLSSTEIKSMLGMSSEANVDQTFSRAVKDMRNLKVQHEEH